MGAPVFRRTILRYISEQYGKVNLCGSVAKMDGPTFVVAGASGYVGKALMESLVARFPQSTLIALSRGQKTCNRPQVQWKSCDLFNLKSLEDSLPARIDVAFYLVHSMGPTSHLDQGTFADYDLILADNFASAVAKRGVSQVIYLSGLIPETESLSPHLKSRLEVEEIFIGKKLPTTIFRAGLIVGPSGSSFQIILKLVTRLPLMVCPGWTQNISTPAPLQVVLDSMADAALNPNSIGEIYDLAGCKSLTYLQMMKDTAAFLKKRRVFLSVPFFSPNLSRLWVSLVTQTPKELVYPLIQSLQHSMVARVSHQYPMKVVEKTYLEILGELPLVKPSPVPFFKKRPRTKTVRSIQRLPLPSGWNSNLVKAEYLRWLPQFMSPLIKVRTEQNQVQFCLFSDKIVLLHLEFREAESCRERQLLVIRGGLLAAPQQSGRLEFRDVPPLNSILAAIHDFRPALPWFIYRASQALIHLWVMKSFGRHLARITAGKGAT